MSTGAGREFSPLENKHLRIRLWKLKIYLGVEHDLIFCAFDID
jgi:hypothetical protein